MMCRSLKGMEGSFRVEGGSYSPTDSHRCRGRRRGSEHVHTPRPTGTAVELIQLHDEPFVLVEAKYSESKVECKSCQINSPPDFSRKCGTTSRTPLPSSLQCHRTACLVGPYHGRSSQATSSSLPCLLDRFLYLTSIHDSVTVTILIAARLCFLYSRTRRTAPS